MNNKHDQERIPMVPIHRRENPLQAPLLNPDLDRLMPKSTDKVAVLPVLNYEISPDDEFKASGLATANTGALKSALGKKDVKEIMIPLGPEPFIGLYLSKPEDDGGRYFLTIYDPRNKMEDMPNFRKNIAEFLQSNGVDSENLSIYKVRISQSERQYNDYSSGDQVIGYSFSEMQSHGQDVSEPNQQSIISAFYQGKETREPGMLRDQIITASKEVGEMALAHPVEAKASVEEAKASVEKDDGFEKRKNENRAALAPLLQKELNQYVEHDEIGNALELFHRVVDFGSQIGMEFKTLDKDAKENLIEQILDKRLLSQDLDKTAESIISQSFDHNSDIQIAQGASVIDRELTHEEILAVSDAVNLMAEDPSENETLKEYFTACIKDPDLLQQALAEGDPRVEILRDVLENNNLMAETPRKGL